MLHHKGLVGLLNGLGHNAALYIAAVNEVIFKVPAASGNHRLSHVSRHPHRFTDAVHRKKVARHLPAKYGINNIFYIVVSGGVEAVLIVVNKADGNVRMRHGDLFHQIRHMGPLRGRRF